MFKFLRTTAFRNLADNETDVSAKNIFFVGENGQGKTNFLEALYFCAYASSFRGVKDAALARSGEKNFSVRAEFCTDKKLSGAIFVKYENLQKTIELDGKKLEDRKYLLEIIPCVVFCHEDMEFVSGTQEKRRWFFDQTQSLYDLVYLDDLRRYKRVLKNRNVILKDFRLGNAGRSETNNMLDVLDEQLVSYGVRLMEKRREAADRFSTVFGSLHGEVSGIEGVTAAYMPSWKTDPVTGEALRRLQERREADIAQGFTLSGPHRDRYVFLRRCPGGDEEFAEKASTGQRRLLALLLRVAQARCFSVITGKTPVLFLDDVLLELDGEKRQRFLSVMPDYRQAFFTFLPEEPYDKYRNSGTMTYSVHGGVVSLCKET
jgi:DNA replication and repair protein RecF